MTTTELRQEIKIRVDRLPPKRLASLAEYVRFLDRPTVLERVLAGEKEIAQGKYVNWRKARSDV